MGRIDPSRYLPSSSKMSHESPGPTGVWHIQIQVLWVPTKNLSQVRGYNSSPTNLTSAATSLNDECIRRGTRQNWSPLSSYWIALTKKSGVCQDLEILSGECQDLETTKSLETLSGQCQDLETVKTKKHCPVTIIAWEPQFQLSLEVQWQHCGDAVRCAHRSDL